MTTAEELKEEGNAFYKNKEWLKAAASYTKGIKLDPENAVLYRSGRCPSATKPYSRARSLVS
eukprot:719922-Pyramimonas_sp.AAC.1